MIQIASLVSVHGQAEPAVKNIITLNTCSSIVGAEVLVCAPAPTTFSPSLDLHAYKRGHERLGSADGCLWHTTMPRFKAITLLNASVNTLDQKSWGIIVCNR